MRYLLPLLLLILTACGSSGRTAGGPYSFAVPDDVKVEVNKARAFYSFTWGEKPNEVLLVFYPHPWRLSQRSMKPMAEVMTIELEEDVKRRPGVRIVSQSQRDIEAGPFSGPELRFQLLNVDGRQALQYVLLLWDGHVVWNGHMTCPTEDDMARAHEILQTAALREEKPDGE